MSSELRVDVTEAQNGIAVVAVAGDLDLETGPGLYRGATQVLDEHPVVILELSGVGFCDSSGYNTLLRLRRRALEAGGQVVMAAPPPQVTRLLTLTGGDSVFGVYSTLAEARAAHQPAADDERPPH
ncbi:anti-sigma factor antagonist [Streptomyces sp. NPDC008265]|uniref:STAS domain-containing protein n=1 Tax=Streptomyces sp. NPDC008265 TaxID=3364824 RepID=UPI0036EBCB5E